ncbi:endo-alpha-N-acetylgalactosaminidase family protein [Paenibacillus sp. NPDC058174]|uniref:endo-alpha-N-acetylgalactosaminidase family protein n=1 Tax=Paenibacillus sp. NPDC058174 TaxID=3346366 RepID=UPI0036D8E33B
MYILENEDLRVELYDWPGIKQYVHKKTGARMNGSGSDGKWALNGNAVSWEQWEIAAAYDPGSAVVAYQMRLREFDLEISVNYQLEQNEVRVTLKVAEDHSQWLQTIDWLEQPLLACSDSSYSYARTEIHAKSWRLIPTGGRGLYDRRQVKELISDSVPDLAAVPTMHTCLFNDELCCFVHTNYPVTPLLSEASGSGKYTGRADSYAIMPNTYQYRVRDEVMEPLEMSVVFLTDSNGDGKADECDYQLWLNRKFPDANRIYKEAIWYKVFCAERKRGVLTTFQETLDIIRQIHHITGGVPQIVYLVGWQFDGHDTGYPSLNVINPKLAVNPDRAREELLELIQTAKEQYNCTISYHINVDDAYEDSPDWNPANLSRDPDGAARVWLDLEQWVYHISHTKDVESGHAFERLKQFLELVPVEKTVHLDAFRNTNTSWDADGYIGPLEELVCGMKPIIAYFNERGIDVSTEGQNGMPIEDSGVFSAYWHFSPSQMYHGKIVGGGSVDLNAVAWGKGASIDADILYRGEPTRLEGEMVQSTAFHDNWNQVVDIIYLGSMLYRFYLEREMVEMREDEHSVMMRFSDGVTVNIDKKNEQLAVKWGSLVIAENHDRFIPTDNRIYAYSRHGVTRAWPLPESWLAADYSVYRLTKNGKELLHDYTVRDGAIELKLEPHVPVMLELKA